MREMARSGPKYGKERSIAGRSGDGVAMRCLGFISVGDPETTSLYWRQLHGEIWRRTGRRHSGRIVAESIDSSAFCSNLIVSREICQAARRLRKCGAQALILGSSALHFHIDAVRQAAGIPVLHIAEAMVEKLNRVGLQPPALVGLNRALDEERIWLRIFGASGFHKTVLPTTLDGNFVQEQLSRGLSEGIDTRDVHAAFTRLTVDLKHVGARVIVLARPELARTLSEETSAVPTICAVQAHCEMAARFVVNGAGDDR